MLDPARDEKQETERLKAVLDGWIEENDDPARTPEPRELVDEIAMLMAYEVTRDLAVEAMKRGALEAPTPARLITDVAATIDDVAIGMPVKVCFEALDDGASEVLTELLLLIDQFEELFSQGTTDAAQKQFLQILYTAVNDPQSRLRLIIQLHQASIAWR